jgi:xanthine dehydrogenase accessory factor
MPAAALTALAALRASLGQTCALSHGPHQACTERWLAERLAPPAAPFYVYGTGLIARALVRALSGLPFEVVWIDQDSSRFPPSPPIHVTLLPSDRQPEIARDAPADTFHAVMTVSHELDFAIVRAVLESGRFGYLGVIGSRMKRKRLEARLGECGIPAERLARLACPIGLPEIDSKTPAVIAISIAAQALQSLQSRRRDSAAASALAETEPYAAGSKR